MVSLGEIKQVTGFLWTDLLRASDSLLIKSFIHGKKGRRKDKRLKRHTILMQRVGPVLIMMTNLMKRVIFETLGTF